MQKKPLRVLFIGNSFSDDTIQWMPEIAESLGVPLKVENLYIGGCSLQTHLENIREDKPAYEWIHRVDGEWIRSPNFRMKDIIASDDWDYLFFQQASGFSGIKESYAPLSELMDRVEVYLKDKNHTKFAWNMTWAYQDDSDHPDFPRYDCDQSKMYQAILEAVRQEVVRLSRFSLIVPIGTAIQNARASFLGDHLTRDGFHLSYQLGRFLAGLTAIQCLGGKDIRGCRFSVVDEKTDMVCKESAIHAVLKPFEITPSESH